MEELSYSSLGIRPKIKQIVNIPFNIAIACRFKVVMGCKKNEKEDLWAPKRSRPSQTHPRMVWHPRRVLGWSAAEIFQRGDFGCLGKSLGLDVQP